MADSKSRMPEELIGLKLELEESITKANVLFPQIQNAVQEFRGAIVDFTAQIARLDQGQIDMKQAIDEVKKKLDQLPCTAHARELAGLKRMSTMWGAVGAALIVVLSAFLHRLKDVIWR